MHEKYAKIKFPAFLCKSLSALDYYGFNIFTHEALREKVQYMHNNPVRAGVVKETCDWPWSSARFWLQGKPVGIRLSWPP